MNILSLQSHVAYGHVGNSAAVFALQRLGIEVWPVHTVQFSNHPGYGGFRGRAFDAGLIGDVVQGIEERGALAACDGVLSGYVGSAEIGAGDPRCRGPREARQPARALLLRSGDRRHRPRRVCPARRRRIHPRST